MKLKSTIAALFTGSAFFSPVANAFWFFQHRATPVKHVVTHNHHIHHHHWHHAARHRQPRTYRRIITEYRIYYIPVPVPGNTRATKSPSEHKSQASLPIRPPSTSDTLSHNPLALATGHLAAGIPAPRDTSQVNVPIKRNNQLTSLGGSGQGSRVAADRRLPPAATTDTTAPGSVKFPTASVQHTLPAPSPLIKSSTELFHMQPTINALPATRMAAAAGHLEHKKRYPLPIMPITAAVAMAGLAYVMARKHKRMKSASTNGKTIIGQDAITSADQTLSDGRSVPLATVHRKGFNYDEIRRVNVDRVFIEPTPKASEQTNMVTAASSTRSLAIHTTGSNSSPPLSSKHSLVQHVYGETITGEITEQYNTPELKAALTGFYENIPAQFHNPAWVKVTYDNGQNYAFAMIQPGQNAQLGDTVRLMFGQQDPPTPNRVIAVIDAPATGNG